MRWIFVVRFWLFESRKALRYRRLRIGCMWVVPPVLRWVKTPELKKTRHRPAVKRDRAALAEDVAANPDSYIVFSG
jgi:hypothetical protein